MLTDHREQSRRGPRVGEGTTQSWDLEDSFARSLYHWHRVDREEAWSHSTGCTSLQVTDAARSKTVKKRKQLIHDNKIRKSLLPVG